jgi:hypothetical protein
MPAILLQARARVKHGWLAIDLEALELRQKDRAEEVRVVDPWLRSKRKDRVEIVLG